MAHGCARESVTWGASLMENIFKTHFQYFHATLKVYFILNQLKENWGPFLLSSVHLLLCKLDL